MKPEIFMRVRHEMSEPASEQEAIDKLAELNAFLGNVKTGARLRAKDKGGVSFLHTRTGTIFGKFLKWLTVAWPGAIQQRIQAKILITNVLSKIECESEEAKKIKQNIFKTLEIKNFSEFNFFKLRTELKSLQFLINKEKGPRSELYPTRAASANSKPNSDDNDFHYGFEISRSNFKRSGNEAVVDLMIESDSEDDSEVDADSVVKSEIKPETSTAPIGNSPPTSTIDESSNIFNSGTTPDQSVKPAIPPDAIAPKPPGPLQTQSHAALPLLSSPTSTQPTNNQNITIFNEPAETNISAIEEKSSFGCFEIRNSLSASSNHKIGAYQADAYIVPSNADDLKFELGASQMEAETDLRNGMHLFAGIHRYHDETRDFKKIQLIPLRHAEDGPLKSMPEQEKKQHHKKLHALYTNALDQAMNAGAKIVALKPLRTQLLTEPEIKTLANAIKEFQQTHAGVKIQVVFASSREVREFNVQIAALQ